MGIEKLCTSEKKTWQERHHWRWAKHGNDEEEEEADQGEEQDPILHAIASPERHKERKSEKESSQKREKYAKFPNRKTRS